MWIAIWRELFFPSLFSDSILIIAFDLVRIKFYLKLHFPEPMLQVESLKFVYFPMILSYDIDIFIDSILRAKRQDRLFILMNMFGKGRIAPFNIPKKNSIHNRKRKRVTFVF